MRDKANIVWLICDVVRDVIPDIEGKLGTLTCGENLFFKSKQFFERLRVERVFDRDELEGWRDFRSLVVDTFPEFKGEVFDNCLFLTPEEQMKVKDRLENLKVFLENIRLKNSEGGKK